MMHSAHLQYWQMLQEKNVEISQIIIFFFEKQPSLKKTQPFILFLDWYKITKFKNINLWV